MRFRAFARFLCLDKNNRSEFLGISFVELVLICYNKHKIIHQCCLSFNSCEYSVGKGWLLKQTWLNCKYCVAEGFLGQGKETFSNQDHAIIKTEGIAIKNN